MLTATRTRQIHGMVLRLGLFYGLGAGTELMARLVRRRLFPMPGSGEGVGSWIYVDDAATAVVQALEGAPPGGVYNVVDDEPVRFRDFVQRLAHEIGAPNPISVPSWLWRIAAPFATADLEARLRVSNLKAKSDLGWTPAFPTFRQGLAEVARLLRAEQ